MQLTSPNAVVPKSAPARRWDIDGLRGLAILLVVIFHVFDGRVSAGVDIFLLLGGLFFFSSQGRNAISDTGLRLWQSVLRMFRRLVPALTLVISATMILVGVTLPAWLWFPKFSEARSAMGYWINWHFALSETGYGEAAAGISPLQHLWSMSAQMQIYLGSLIIVVLIAVLSKGAATLVAKLSGGVPDRGKLQVWYTRIIVVVLIVGTVASFWYASWMVEQNQLLNYYSTFTRFWEVGLGGLIGYALGMRSASGSLRWTLPVWLRWVFSVVGLGIILVTPFILDGVEVFPGPWTLVPLSGAILILWAGHNVTSHVGVNWVLTTGVWAFLGKISYSLYLWHWPLLIILMGYFRVESHDVLFGILIIIVSVALAWVTHKYVESPLQQQVKPERSAPTLRYLSRAVARNTGVKGVLMPVAAVVVSAATAWILMLPVIFAEATDDRATILRSAATEENYPGARAVLEGVDVPPVTKPLPDVINVSQMLPETQRDGCYADKEQDVVILTANHGASEVDCLYGDVDSDRVLYLVGGSHSEHFLPALDEIGLREGFAVFPILKMGCPVNLHNPLWDGGPYPECESWGDNVRQWIMDNPPTEGVFMTSTRPFNAAGDGPEIAPVEYVEVVREFTDAGITTFGVRDNPWPQSEPGVPTDARVCVGEVRDDCDFTDQYEEFSPALWAYAGTDMVHLDFHNLYCADGYCPAIIGNQVVYRDSHHLTNMFVESMTEEIYRQMFIDPVTAADVDAGLPGPVLPRVR